MATEHRSTTPRRVGSPRAAREALQGRLRLVGSGQYRHVFAPRLCRTVYKVERMNRCNGDNAREYELAAKATSDGLEGIPPVTLYRIDGRDIIAMPYYPGDSDDPGPYPPDEWDEYFGDLHDGNWRRDADGTPYVTDMQFEPDGGENGERCDSGWHEPHSSACQWCGGAACTRHGSNGTNTAHRKDGERRAWLIHRVAGVLEPQEAVARADAAMNRSLPWDDPAYIIRYDPTIGWHAVAVDADGPEPMPYIPLGQMVLAEREDYDTRL